MTTIDHRIKFTILHKLINESGQHPLILCSVLVLTALLLYAPVAHYDFVGLDDSAYIQENMHVHTGFNLANTYWAFTSFYMGNWHPVTWISHMADSQLFDLNSGPPHVVNVLLHAANVVLLFWLLQKATGAVWRSFVVAALFAVHPLNVETVAWVAERKSLLCTFFSLLTIAAYGWYVRRPDSNKYLVILVAFSLALMSKPMAVSLPIVLLLLDYWPLKRCEELPFRRKWLRLATEKLPLFLMSTASSAVTIVAQRSGGALADPSVLPLSVRLGNAVVSYVAYIVKLLWPAKLAVFYAHPKQSLLWYSIAGAAAILAAITMAVYYFRPSRYFVVGWSLFVITLIPVIGIIQVGRQAMADRYAYIPYIGLFIILVWSFSDIADQMSMNRVVQASASLCLIVAFTLASSHYLRYWQNEVTLFTQARNVAVQPHPLIEDCLGDGLMAAGRSDEALEHYQLACSLEYKNELCHYNIARILFARNEFDKGIEECHIAALLANPYRVSVSINCYIASGSVMMNLGRFDEAEREFEAALSIDPNDPSALRLRQEALRRMKEGSR